MIELLKCKVCGGELTYDVDTKLCKCDYCGHQHVIPSNRDGQRIQMFNRGNRFRLRAEYDRAIQLFERVVEMDDTDAEAHWCLALSRHGIEYVGEDSHKVPTCNRIGYETILEDIDYQDAIQHADASMRHIYERDAVEIATVQREIIQKSKDVELFDVFICYKDKTSDGERTQDSLIAQDLYERLTKEGFRVFFSRITLEDKPGIEFEPYIFAALHSSSVMLVVGSCAEYINSPWVRNEWCRYLTLTKQENDRLIIPCIQDMDPDDLPDELAVLQYVNMEKVGWIQDLLHSINKLHDGKKSGTAKLENLLERCHQYLEVRHWEEAKQYCDRILDENTTVGLAYLYKLMAEVRVNSDDELATLETEMPIKEYPDFKWARKYGNPELQVRLDKLEAAIGQRAEEEAQKKEEERRKRSAALAKERREMLEKAEEYAKAKDAYSYLKRKYAASVFCQYGMIQKAWSTFDFSSIFLEEPSRKFHMVNSEEVYKGIVQKISDDYFVVDEGIALIKDEIFRGAAKMCRLLGVTYILTYDGNVYADAGGIKEALSWSSESPMKLWKNATWNHILDIQSNEKFIVGLREDGTMVTAGGDLFNRKKIEKWNHIRQFSLTDTICAGVTTDGGVVALGENTFGQCNVDEWFSIEQVSAGLKHVVGLKQDGTVLATGYNGDGCCNVSNWKKIIAVKAYSTSTLALCADGTLVSTTDESIAVAQSPENVLDICEFDEYRRDLKNMQLQIQEANSISSRISSLWTEKKNLKVWQGKRKKSILDAIIILSSKIEEINKTLPVWHKVSVEKSVLTWLMRNSNDTRELTDAEANYRLKVLAYIGIIVGFIAGIILIYVDSNGKIGGIAGIFACAIILLFAMVFGICSVFLVYGLIHLIISIIKQAQKI